MEFQLSFAISHSTTILQVFNTITAAEVGDSQCQPEDEHHTHLNQVDPITCISRAVNEEVRVVEMVDNEEERQCELLRRGNEIEEHIARRYARAISSRHGAMELR